MIGVDLSLANGPFRLDVSFETGVRATALFGRSGAGKTTVLEAIAGLRRPDEGRITALGEVLFDSRAGIDLPPERRGAGVVFQDTRLFPHLSVERNLRYGARRAVRGGRGAPFGPVVELLGLGSLLRRRPASLSGGERQRVAIGRALCSGPRFLLLDEPFTGLDGVHRDTLLTYLGGVPKELGVPILVVTHAVDDVLALADDIVVLEQGRAVATGPLERVLGRIDLPALPGLADLGAVLAATVERPDDGYGLTELRLPGGTLRVPRIDLPAGTPVRVRVAAKDVGIALEPPRGVSIQNILAARVERLRPAADPALVDVRLGGCAGSEGGLWARVTARAVAELALAPGLEVHALVKSVSIPKTALAPAPIRDQRAAPSRAVGAPPAASTAP